MKPARRLSDMHARQIKDLARRYDPPPPAAEGQPTTFRPRRTIPATVLEGDAREDVAASILAPREP